MLSTYNRAWHKACSQSVLAITTKKLHLLIRFKSLGENRSACLLQDFGVALRGFLACCLPGRKQESSLLASS